MTQIDESSRRAARALGERLARVGQEEPRRASFTDVGTIESVLADGTALVSYRGGTIGPLPMTCDCVCAAKGRSCVIAIDGPIVRVIGIIARSSTDFEVPATAVTGTLPVSHGGTGATTAASARSSLGLGSTPVTLVRQVIHNTTGGTRFFVIGHSSYASSSSNQAGTIRAVGSIGGLGGATQCAFDVTVNTRDSTLVHASHLAVMNSGIAGISARKTSDGRVWLYAWTTAEWLWADISASASWAASLDGTWQGSTPAGDLVWAGGNAAGHSLSPRLYSGMALGTGLKASGTTLSVDNGAYVKLLWSGKTQSAVKLSASCASFRAIVAAVGGNDGVVEASTLVWAPNGRTFDVAAAFVVGNSDWRSLRMRFTARDSTLTPTYNLGQQAGSAGASAYLLYVVGIV